MAAAQRPAASRRRTDPAAGSTGREPGPAPSFDPWDLRELQSGSGRRVALPGRKTAPTTSTGPRSLTRVLQILDLLSAHGDGRTLAQLCADLEAPRSSTYALLQPMVSRGYLSRREGRYRLGPAAFSLASGILNARDEPYLVQSVLGMLSERTALSIMHSQFMRDEEAIVHRQVVQSTRSIRYITSPGVPRPLLTTAAGRAVLAHAGDAWTSAFLDRLRTRPSMRAGSPARRAYAAMLEQVRRQGFAISLGDFDSGVGAVAAPILDAEGLATGSIGVAGPVSEIRAELEVLTRLVKQAGRQLSQGLASPGGLPRKGRVA